MSPDEVTAEILNISRNGATPPHRGTTGLGTGLNDVGASPTPLKGTGRPLYIAILGVGGGGLTDSLIANDQQNDRPDGPGRPARSLGIGRNLNIIILMVILIPFSLLGVISFLRPLQTSRSHYPMGNDSLSIRMIPVPDEFDHSAHLLISIVVPYTTDLDRLARLQSDISQSVRKTNFCLTKYLACALRDSYLSYPNGLDLRVRSKVHRNLDTFRQEITSTHHQAVELYQEYDSIQSAYPRLNRTVTDQFDTRLRRVISNLRIVKWLKQD